MSISIALTPTDRLSLSTDGHISDRAWAAARAATRAHAAKRSTGPARIKVGRITMKPATAVALMAGAIRRCAFARGEVTRADFERLGLNGCQIDAFKDQAFARAALDEPRILDALAA